jgi:glycine C-acetyltransferase/8-amino-7-oxononanoate synthase
MSDLFHEQLQALRAQSLHRKLRVIGTAQGAEIGVVGQHLVNFSSDDYLGLANDPILRDAAIAAIGEFGVGAGASRLLTGTQSPHVRLETALANWKNTPAALCFSSGYAAALGTMPAIVGKNDVVVLDKLCHAALTDAARLSGATIRLFAHNHLGKLESHLEWARREHPESRLLVVTEAVFATDGDRAPLRELVGLKKRFGAMLFVDESHSAGVIGANGRGLVAEENLAREVDVQMGTLSKALGGSGGYVCGSRSLVDWLVNRARSFIFSTAPAPALAAAATAAIEFLSSDAGEQRRLTLWRRIEALRHRLAEQSIATAGTTVDGSAIHPLVVGDEQTAIDLSRALHTDGFLVPAIRYPTVSKGAARLRITVTAGHDEQQIRRLAEALGRLRPELASAA